MSSTSTTRRWSIRRLLPGDAGAAAPGSAAIAGCKEGRPGIAGMPLRPEGFRDPLLRASRPATEPPGIGEQDLLATLDGEVGPQAVLVRYSSSKERARKRRELLAEMQKLLDELAALPRRPTSGR